MPDFLIFLQRRSWSGKSGPSVRALLALGLSTLAVLVHAPAFAEPPGQDFAWTDNQDRAECPKKPIWTMAVQGSSLLFRTRNFDYQAVAVALRGDGSASMDRVFQPGRNLKYRISGTFDGRGLMKLRLEDLAREGRPCSWRLEAEYPDGVIPGVKATRSRSP